MARERPRLQNCYKITQQWIERVTLTLLQQRASHVADHDGHQLHVGAEQGGDERVVQFEAVVASNCAAGAASGGARRRRAPVLAVIDALVHERKAGLQEGVSAGDE
jgi:hypothetical protein